MPALSPSASSVDAEVEGQDVLVDIMSRSLRDMLSALHDCIVENEIPLVRIQIDARTYLMEPEPSD